MTDNWKRIFYRYNSIHVYNVRVINPLIIINKNIYVHFSNVFLYIFSINTKLMKAEFIIKLYVGVYILSKAKFNLRKRKSENVKLLNVFC